MYCLGYPSAEIVTTAVLVLSVLFSVVVRFNVEVPADSPLVLNVSHDWSELAVQFTLEFTHILIGDEYPSLGPKQ